VTVDARNSRAFTKANKSKKGGIRSRALRARQRTISKGGGGGGVVWVVGVLVGGGGGGGGVWGGGGGGGGGWVGGGGGGWGGGVFHYSKLASPLLLFVITQGRGPIPSFLWKKDGLIP